MIIRACGGITSNGDIFTKYFILYPFLISDIDMGKI
jgi:hypothetical protein